MLKHWDENLCFHAETTTVVKNSKSMTAETMTYSSSPVRPPHCGTSRGPSRSRSTITGKNSVVQTSSSVTTLRNPPLTLGRPTHHPRVVCVYFPHERSMSLGFLWTQTEFGSVAIWDTVSTLDPHRSQWRSRNSRNPICDTPFSTRALRIKDRMKTYTLTQFDDNPHCQPPRTSDVRQKHEMAH